MYQSYIDEYKEKFEDTITHLQEELGKIRTGRAHASLIEGISVDAYGAKSPIRDLANISTLDARTLTVQPWDKNITKSIEVALRDANLGVNPVVDGQIVRITLPALTEERRKELVKGMNEKSEEARIAIRSVRENIWSAMQDAQKNGDIGEDDKFQGKEKLQKIVDEHNARVEELRGKKEEEIMSI